VVGSLRKALVDLAERCPLSFDKQMLFGTKMIVQKAL